MVQKLRASARMKPRLIDERGEEAARGRATPSLSPRVGTPSRRTLPVGDGVCVGGGTDHHVDLAPHGPWLLLGNPNRPDGLRLVHREDLVDIARLAGLDDVLSLGGNPIISDPEQLDDALTRIRAGPVATDAA